MALDALLDAIERLPAFHRVLNTLPSPGDRLVAGGLPGSADAAMVAALARRLTTRFFVVATDGVGEAERWLADLETLLTDAPIALYPAREGFGEAEPHMEVAGSVSNARAADARRAAHSAHHGARAARENANAAGACKSCASSFAKAKLTD